MPNHTRQPPVARVMPTVRDVHGQRVVDDYAWLRDTSRVDTLDYLRAEREYYDAATAHTGPFRDSLFHEMASRTLLTDRSVSWTRAGQVYYTRDEPGRDHEIFCRRASDTAAEQVLLDLSALAPDGGFIELGVREVSPDGKLLAYSVDTDGDEVFELRLRDLGTGADLDDVVPRSYYGCAWSADSRSVFYTVHDDAYRPYQVRRHRLGGRVADDVVVRQEDDARFELSVEGTRSGEWVVLTSASRDTTELWVIPASAPESAAQLVKPRRPGVEYLLDHERGVDGGRFLIVSDQGEPEFELFTAPVTEPAAWALVEPARAGERLLEVDAFAGYALLSLRRGGVPLLRVVPTSASGEEREITAETDAWSVQMGRNEDYDTSYVTVVSESMIDPPSWWDVNLATGERDLRHRRIAPGHDPSRYVTRRLSVAARDGTPIPVTLAHLAGRPPDARTPCLLYGYGAYEASLDPQFDVSLPVLLDRGVAYAVAHVRGGGENGRWWWQQGRLRAKPTTFDDFVDVADALAAGVVDGNRIVSRGLSAGGLLQGAVFSRAPARWRAVVAEVPFVDCVTTMLDPSIPLTVAEWDEWGDPRDPDDYACLASYSPYENVPSGMRPDLLVTGSLHDPRVLVHEPAKWVARLRATDERDSRLLFRAELGAGAHTGPSGRFARLRYEAEVLAFVLDAVDALDVVDVLDVAEPAPPG